MLHSEKCSAPDLFTYSFMCDKAKLKHTQYDIASVDVMCHIKEISVSFAEHNIHENYAYDICQNPHVKYI